MWRSQVLRLVEVGNGFKRTVSIQDVQAPPSVVWDRIMDLPKYPKMVEGCVSCVPYKREKRLGGTQVVYAKYKIRAAALTMEYFMKHTYEPGKNCMTFHLDYDRLSELADTVGYWYVEKLDDGWCRIYYSTDSQVPACERLGPCMGEAGPLVARGCSPDRCRTPRACTHSARIACMLPGCYPLS